MGVGLHSFEYGVFSCAPCVSSRSPDPSSCLPSSVHWDDAAGNNEED